MYGLILTMFDTLSEKCLSRRIVKACQQALRNEHGSSCIASLNFFLCAHHCYFIVVDFEWGGSSLYVGTTDDR
jgi:hypothetical protein